LVCFFFLEDEKALLAFTVFSEHAGKMCMSVVQDGKPAPAVCT